MDEDRPARRPRQVRLLPTTSAFLHFVPCIRRQSAACSSPPSLPPIPRQLPALHRTHLVARAHAPGSVGNGDDARDGDDSVAGPVPGARPPASGRAPHLLGEWVLCLSLAVSLRACCRVVEPQSAVEEGAGEGGHGAPPLALLSAPLPRPLRQRVRILTPPPCLSAGRHLHQLTIVMSVDRGLGGRFEMGWRWFGRGVSGWTLCVPR